MAQATTLREKEAAAFARLAEYGLFVIAAAQTVESVVGPASTQANVSDVQNAVWDGADAVILGGVGAATSSRARQCTPRPRRFWRPSPRSTCLSPRSSTASPVRRPTAAGDGRLQADDQGRGHPRSVFLERGDDPQDARGRHGHPPERRFREGLPLIRRYATLLESNVEVLGDRQGPKFQIAESTGDLLPWMDSGTLKFGICRDDSDNVRTGRITVTSTRSRRPSSTLAWSARRSCSRTGSWS